MTLLTMPSPNPTLKGHKLLILYFSSAPSSTWLAQLRAKFPDLKIATHALAWGEKWTPDKFPESEWRDATVLLTSSFLPTIEQAPLVQYVQLSSAGANHLADNPFFRDTKITFASASGVHGPQISEWVISTLLSNYHDLPHYLDLQKEAKWERSAVGRPVIEDAYGQRIGILGYGSIGRQVARISVAMGLSVHAYTLHARDTPESRKDHGWWPAGTGDPDGVFPSAWFSGESTAELHAFLDSGLDVLLVSLPLTPKTKGLISKPEFEILAKRGTFVSNIGRGPIIDTDALIEALNDGKIRGAALDVTDPEPLPDGHPLWSAKNVQVTPHVSGQSTKYYERVYSILEYNLERLSEGKPLVNRVSRKEGY